jgi:hypothetical protein
MTTCTIIVHRREDTKHHSEVIIEHDGRHYLSRLPFLVDDNKFNEQHQIVEFQQRQKQKARVWAEQDKNK